MSDQSTEAREVTRLAERAAEAAIDALWRQWAIVNPMVRTERPRGRGCLLDPEALILGSLAVADRESRLTDMVAWWARTASNLLSVQRMRTLQTEFAGAGEPLPWFAHWAAHLGGDGRWKGMAEEPEGPGPRPGKGPDLPRLDDPATLMVKLRAGFGVGVKADLLAYLICLRGESRSATEIARAIGYTDKTVRIAGRDLAYGGFVEEIDDHPSRYATVPDVAQSLLVLMYGRRKQAAAPGWCYLAQVLSFLLGVAGWGTNPELIGNAYLASSRARDMFEKYEGTFRAIGLRMPRPEPYPGADYLAPFQEFVAEVGSWLDATG